MKLYENQQKPKQVIRTITDHLETKTANVHRGIHTLSNLATEAFEEARNKVCKHFRFVFSKKEVFIIDICFFLQVSRFINTSSSSEVVFT